MRILKGEGNHISNEGKSWTRCEVVFKGNHTSNAAFEGAELGKSGQGTSSPCLLSATAAGEATTV